MKKAGIRSHNGAPTLFVDGSPHSGFAYMSFNLQERYARQFADRGVDLFMLSVSPDYDYMQISSDGWPTPDRHSYADFDARMQTILRACPQASVFPRLYLCSPPWWDKEHPQELMQGVDGLYDPVANFGFLPRDVDEQKLGLAKMTVPSVSSEAWLEFSANALRQFLRYAEATYGDSIVGYLICSGGTQEWYYWGAFEDIFPDQSRPHQEAFRSWLSDRGRNPGTGDPIPPLSARKGSELGLFRDPTSQSGSLAIEYWKFHAWAIENAMSRFCRVARQTVGPDRILGVFYGYFVDLQRQENCWHNSGHLAFRRMSLDPNIDFVTSPTSYKDRKMGGFSIFNSLTESLAHHGKVWWDENDILTPLAAECKSDLFYMPKSARESLHLQRREFANALCHGSPMWWFDMFGGWYDDEATMSDVGRMTDIARKALAFDRSGDADVAVVLDDESICYTECTNRLTVPLVTDQLMELGHTGAPFSMVHVEDIADIRRHKVYLFVNVFHVDDRRLAAILSCIRGPGITSIFVYAQGIANDTLSVENIEKLTGLRLAMDPAAQAIRVRTSKRHGSGVYGPAATLAPLVYSVDREAEVLGTVAGSSRAGLVRKRIGEAWSVFSAAPCIPADLLRSLFADAGCRVYTQGGEVVYASKSFLSVSGLPGTLVRLNSPDRCLFELFSETEYPIRDGSVELSGSEIGVWVFFRGSRNEWVAGRQSG